MLLRFTSPDMLNTSLVDTSTGQRSYDITTELLAEPSSPSSSRTASFSATASVALSPSEELASSSSSTVWKGEPAPSHAESSTATEYRRTKITDASGKLLVDVTWKGRRPDISIGDEKIGGLTELFGSSTTRFMPKVLAIPTRFDTEYVWLATAESLSLFDYDKNTVRGSLHQNCIRIPAPLKSSKSKLSPPSPQMKRKPSKLSIFTSSKDVEESPSYCDDVPISPSSSKATLIPTHVPGLGSNYLEFESHPLALDVEIILSFIMMEILRRGRFSLTPYTFDRPTSMWQFKEAKELLLRRLRRNTV